MMTPDAPLPDRRTRILEAALGCFLARGYLATTIADIRRASGASTGSIYHFFGSKGALAQALLSQAVAGWSAASAEALAPGADAERAIKASVSGLVAWGAANPALLRFLDEIRTLAARDPDFAQVRESLARGQAAAEARYREFARRGEVRPLPWAVAYALMLGPAYNLLRLTAGAVEPGTAELLADAAWTAVRLPPSAAGPRP